MLDIMKRMRTDEWFFLGFLFTYTLSIRKVLYFVPIRGNFNEYTGIYLYLSDLFIFATLCSWGYWSILQHKKGQKSTENESNKINVPRGTYKLTKIFFKNNAQVIHSFVKYSWLLLIVYLFISITWSNAHNIALFRVFKSLEFGLLFLYLVKNVPRGTFFKRILWITILVGVLNSVVGILQIILQHSIGMSWLRESFLNTSTDGVAKVILGNTKVLRAYGLFPHPNIFGGFLVMSITFNLILLKMFHVEHDLNKKSENYCINCSTWNKMRRYCLKVVQNVPRGTLLFVSLILQSVGLAITFSKSAWAAMIMILTYIFLRNVPRGTRIYSYLFSKKIILLLLIVIMAILSLNYNLKENLSKSVEDRLEYINVSRGTISNNLWLGIGLGQSVVDLVGNDDLKDWQFQPVHNVFLLIIQEIGLVGTLIIVCIMLFMFHVEHFKKQDTSMYFKALISGFAFVMLFDHYFWDIQQGQLMLVIVLSLLKRT
jgi:hypothetical protein